MLRITNDSRDINIVEWAAFVNNHPCGNFFQTPYYYDIYSHSKKCQPAITFITDEKKIIGLFVSIIYENGSLFVKRFTKRAICMGGPLVLNDNTSVERLLFESHKRLLNSLGCIYCEIRPVIKPEEKKYLVNNFKYVPHISLLLDLTVSINDLYQNLHKERRRNIKYAEKEGLVFKELTTSREIDEFISIIKRTYERKRVPLSYSEIFNSAFEKYNSNIHFFGCFVNNKMIGAQVRIFYKEYAYAWFAGSYEEYFKYKPNDFLTWNVLLWSKAYGYSIFDFGGGGKPGVPYGVRDYKLKYGCTQYEFGRYQYIYRPVLYKLGELGYSLIHRAK